MATNSQFLFFYVDELIKHHWVNWLEGPLAVIPQEEHRGVRGFQQVIGDTGAGPRTRAGEAYQLGILSGRIVRPQVKGASFPSGWQQVLEGDVPSTKLGFYSYVIGKALRENQEDPNLGRALDCLASILVLHIGFRVEDRWFNTALVFQFAHNQMAQTLNRELTSDELRFLSAAVINTLDSDENSLLLQAYATDQQIEKLRFDLTDGQTVYFKLAEFAKIVADNDIGVNDFKRTKAALFWANPDRGIFSRAVRSQGRHMINELMRVDQSLIRMGKGNLLDEVFNSIHANVENLGIFQLADTSFTDFPDLLSAWQDLDAELFDATNKAAEAVELSTAPPIWRASQKEIRGTTLRREANSTTSIDTERAVVASQKADTSSASSPPLIATGASTKKVPKQELQFPNLDVLRSFVENEFDQIAEDPPTSSAPAAKSVERRKVRATKTDFAAKEARNRQLGEAGELFVLRYEIHKLTTAGENELAKRVAWVSKEYGDGFGYDIRSFDLDGSEIFLEVKTTTGGRATPFFVSTNEVYVSEEKGTSYRLVRVFDFLKKPRFFTLSGSLSNSVKLEATSYRARV